MKASVNILSIDITVSIMKHGDGKRLLVKIELTMRYNIASVCVSERQRECECKKEE